VPEPVPPLDLTNLRGGAAIELWQVELRKVLENIADPNIPHKGKRTITLKVAFEPNDTRERLDVNIDCESKLVPARGTDTVAYVTNNGHELVAVEHNPKQTHLAFSVGMPAGNGGGKP
jgi:hypothetical protein